MEVVVGILGVALMVLAGVACGMAGVCAGCFAGIGIAVANVWQAAGSGFHFRAWSWPERPDADPAIRSYFFGPGLQQLGTVVRGAFMSMETSTETFSDQQDDISIWGAGSELSVLVEVFAFTYMICGVAVSFITTMIVSFVLTVVLGAPFLAISALCVLFLLCARFSDALYLRIRRIRASSAARIAGISRIGKV